MSQEWLEAEEDIEEGYPIEYSITSSPNDFNINTLFDFLESGIIRIPGFQRNYVWDKKRASRLIESIIMGIPIPQIFLYERSKNDFLVIDGQQRLMTVYYFLKGRFPRDDMRAELRKYIDEHGNIPPNILADKKYFVDFDLDLGSRYSDAPNRLDGRNYLTLIDDDKLTLGLRTIRCIVIKQHEPPDDSSMYEIFYRLNTGGVNLTAQEIRSSLYHSEFYDMIVKANLDNRWRRITTPEPDTRMRDMEVLLRGFAMLIDDKNYKEPMIRFLNTFSLKAKSFSSDYIKYLESLFDVFLRKTEQLPVGAFQLQSGRVSPSIYEAVFTASCENAFKQKNLDVKIIEPIKLENLKKDPEFLSAIRVKTTRKENVKKRIEKAKEILFQ